MPSRYTYMQIHYNNSLCSGKAIQNTNAQKPQHSSTLFCAHLHQPYFCTYIYIHICYSFCKSQKDWFITLFANILIVITKKKAVFNIHFTLVHNSLRFFFKSFHFFFCILIRVKYCFAKYCAHITYLWSMPIKTAEGKKENLLCARLKLVYYISLC